MMIKIVLFTKVPTGSRMQTVFLLVCSSTRTESCLGDKM